MKKVILALTAATMLSAAMTPILSSARERGFSQRPDAESRHENRQERRLERLTTLLDLTDQQQVSISTLNETFGEQTQELRQSMKENRDILKTLTEADPVDMNTIQQVADDQGDLFAALVVLKIDKRMAFSAVLTADQLAKLEELHAVMADRRAHEEAELDG
jgi:Spy/CpxP family protein refolding chaperone